MASTYTVLLSELVSEFKLDFFYRSTDFDKIHVTVDDISRPGLHLAGFFDHYEPMRVYVCGTVETAYLQKLTPEERIIIFDHFLSYKCPALIFARGFEPMPECLEMAKKYDVTVLGTKDTTSYIVSSLITYLKSSLAPRVTRHGVLVEIYGEGILINGDSGIGKSETAIELVKRGHRLIADDAVEIKKVSPHELVGSAPPVLKHYIELRGIGVINVAKLFGMGAVRTENEIKFTQIGETLLPYQLSSGEKQILVILLTVLVEDRKNYVLFMDEPEVSLHVEWQKQLIDLILRLNPNVQIILSTHSPAVIMNGWMDKVTEVSDITVED